MPVFEKMPVLKNTGFQKSPVFKNCPVGIITVVRMSDPSADKWECRWIPDSITVVRDMSITSIPNKTSEHNAWGFQLIKVREIKRMMSLHARYLPIYF